MSENNNAPSAFNVGPQNEEKWVEVEQVTETPAAAPEAPAFDAATVEETIAEAPKAPEADPFNVEAKVVDAYENVERVEAEVVEDPFSFNQQYDNVNGTAGAQGEAPEHGKAVASLVLGIVGICCCGICGLIGLVLSIQAKNAGNQEGICKAGFVLGIIACVLWACGLMYNFVIN